VSGTDRALPVRRLAAAPMTGGCFRGGVVSYASEAKVRVLGTAVAATGLAARLEVPTAEAVPRRQRSPGRPGHG
jgi:hypothetical protein